VATLIRKNPTLFDVAEKAGVSKSTVSRVINGAGYVSEDARKSIEEAMGTLGYRPNTMARSLRTSRTMTIGLAVPTFVNEVYAALAEGATNVLERSGRTLLIGTSGVDGHRELEVVDQLLSRNVDGLMLAIADESNKAIRDRVAAIAGIPVVLIDREIGPPNRIDRVLVDHWPGIVAAAKDLKRVGHKRIAMIAPPETIRPGREAALALASVYPKARVIHLPLTFEAGRNAAASMFDLADRARPTAIIVCGTTVLAGVIDALHSRRMTVPRDLSLIAYDASTLARLSSPPIATITRDIVGIGVATAELMVSRVSGARPPGQVVTVATSYMPAGSVSEPR
jgi:LacI family transcriptional regulator